MKNVVGVLIVDREGVLIKSTINEVVDSIQNYGLSIATIIESANKAMIENGELQFLRMKTKKNEFIVVPGTWHREEVGSLCFYLKLFPFCR